MLKENKTTRRRVVDPALQIDAVMAGARRSSNSKPNEFPGSATDEIPLTSDASFTQICGCRVFRTLRHFSHILAKCACRIYFPHKLALSTAISIFCVFLFEAVFVVIRKWQTICKVNLKKILQTALNLLNLKVIVFTLGIISVKLGQKNSCTIQILLLAYLRSLHVICSCSCSLALLDPRVGHTMDVLSPFIPVLCHSD